MRILQWVAGSIAVIIIWYNVYQWFYDKMSSIMTRITERDNVLIFIFAPIVTPFIILHKVIKKFFDFLDKE